MLYFNLDRPKKDLTELLCYGFSNTIYGFFMPTFKDVDLTILDYKSGRRSFYDLYEIATTYFPLTTEAELAYILINKLYLRAFICPNINKIVFVQDSSKKTCEWTPMDNKDPDDKDGTNLSFSDILQLAKEYVHMVPIPVDCKTITKQDEVIPAINS